MINFVYDRAGYERHNGITHAVEIGDDFLVAINAITNMTPQISGYIAVGSAKCSPKDQFSRKMGRDIAQSRMVKELFALKSLDIVYNDNLQMNTIQNCRLESDNYVIYLCRYRGNLGIRAVYKR